jgi:hypothetical protein
MKAWFYVRWIKNGDEFDERYETQEEAERKARYLWNALTKYDQDRTESAYVGEYEIDEDGCPNLAVGTNPTLVFK